MKCKKFSHFLLVFITLTNLVFGQEQDSVKTYELDEITVKSGIVTQPKQILEIKYKEIENSDATVLSELGKYIPSVKTQTNSRGETLLYLRGSNTRQIALFFDGVPLNIPWDNRIDLSQIPTSSIEEISVTKGIPSVVYGANTPAGVININSKEFDGENKRSVLLQLGQNRFQKYDFSAIGAFGKLSYLASFTYNSTNGYSLPKSYSNIEQNPAKIRKNSDRENANIFAKIRYNANSLNNIGLTFSYIDAKKGVPPETDVSRPRFWRYPKWQKSSLGLNGSFSLNNNAKNIIAYSISASSSKIEINQYSDLSFSNINEIEKDDDKVIYGRLIFTKLLGKSSILKFTANGLSTLHKESFMTENYTEEKYSQNIFSVGSEYEYISKNFKMLFGTTIDASNTPQTGDKPSKNGNSDYSYNAAIVYSFDDNFAAQLNYGRKLRFPTPRESFSGALGRFVPNPGLGPEISNGGELNIAYNSQNITAGLTFFGTILKDGIIRKTIIVDGNKKFKRVNEDRIRNVGVEFNSNIDLSKDLLFNFNFTYMKSNAKNENGEFSDTLEYKPSLISGMSLYYSFTEKLETTIEGNFIGDEFGLQEGNIYFKKLPNYFLLNFRISYDIDINSSFKSKLFFRVNNVLDKLYFTQWSLPEAGREFWFGLKTDF